MYNFHVTPEAWEKFDTNNQLGNIGSEVGRAIIAHRKNMPDLEEGAKFRALELFYLTNEQSLREGNFERLHEVNRAKYEFLELFEDEEKFARDSERVEQYFMDYALLARQAHYEKLEAEGKL